MKHLAILIKPASSLCNLRCSYCFYANVSSLREVRSFGQMTKETVEQMITQLFIDLEDGDQLSLAFQGGEPTLASLSFFEFLVAKVKEQPEKVTVHYSLQTNGTLINTRWCRFLKEHDFLVGLSLDGYAQHHDQYRVNTKKQGSFQRVLKAKHLFDQWQIPYNILCVLTEELAAHPQEVYAFMQEEAVEFIQFIPCLEDLDATTKSRYSLTPESFYSFYDTLLRLWQQELETWHYRSIKLLDDVINLMVRKQVNACGLLGNCQIQYVIEADGSVYPCDFYVLDDYRLGYIQEHSLRELFEQENARKFLCDKRQLTTNCQTCPFLNRCFGGCKRMKEAMYVNEETGFCGYQALLRTLLPAIPDILCALERTSE